MDVARIARVVSYALATLVLLVTVPAFAHLVGFPLGFLDAPSVLKRVVRVPARLSLGWEREISALPALVCLFLALALSLVARAITTTAPAEIALATFSVPCLLSSMGALYSFSIAASEGLLWVIGTVVAGTLLAAVVFADAVLTHASRVHPT
ncbi:hypothetical protein [Halomontanus rarus]|uniref:hypothetical protein n=1 Tax=Halomontanus rarus TaxID=3034020 RepID=UPI001A99B4CC